MNQVTEMLRLAPGASDRDAVARLAGLFEIMSRQPGFQSAEVLRRIDRPDTLLVLHAWDRIEDWQAFQRSEAKVSFSASRPASLYSFVPCGMNWRLEAAVGDVAEGPFLRREVLRGPAALAAATSDILAGATFSYADDEPEFAGATLRLTRLQSALGTSDIAPDPVLADEVYESLMRSGRMVAQSASLRTIP
jgi:heme-degrading monooxygenase HmoA